MQMWLKLSEGLFFIGQGGVNRIEPIDSRYQEGPYKTILYSNNSKISAVKETLADIQKLLDNVREKGDT